MKKEEIIKLMTSKECENIRIAGLEIIQNSQNEKLIKELIPYKNVILKATKNLELGGGFISNNRFYQFPLEIIEFHRNLKSFWKRKQKCTCKIYLSNSYQTFNPEKEAENKTINLNLKIKGNYSFDSEVECLKCNTKFYVSEREYHYTWWKWIEMTENIKLNSCGNENLDKEVNFLISSIASTINKEPENITNLKYHKERLLGFRMKLGNNKATEFLESKYKWNKYFKKIEKELELKTKHNTIYNLLLASSLLAKILADFLCQ